MRVPLLLVLIIPSSSGSAISPRTDEFVAQTQPAPLKFSLAHANWRFVIGIMMVTMTTVSFYMITAFTPTFAIRSTSRKH